MVWYSYSTRQQCIRGLLVLTTNCICFGDHKVALSSCNHLLSSAYNLYFPSSLTHRKNTTSTKTKWSLIYRSLSSPTLQFEFTWTQQNHYVIMRYGGEWYWEGGDTHTFTFSSAATQCRVKKVTGSRWMQFSRKMYGEKKKALYNLTCVIKGFVILQAASIFTNVHKFGLPLYKKYK